MPSPDPIPVTLSLYLRSNDQCPDAGDTFYAESLAEALTHLTSESGYRLTVADGEGRSIVLRTCSEDWEDGPLPGDRSHGPSLAVIVRGLGALLSDPLDLLDPGEQARLSASLQSMVDKRRRAEVESADIPLG